MSLLMPPVSLPPKTNGGEGDFLLHKLVSGYDDDPQENGRRMRRMLEQDREGLYAEAVRVLSYSQESRGLRCLIAMLMMNDLLFPCLCEPSLGSREACNILRIAAEVNRTVYAQMARNIASKAARASGSAQNVRITRLADFLGTVSEVSGTPLPLTTLLDHDDVRVRSKATIMMGRANQNVDWVQKRLVDPDERVRGNAVESIWGLDSPQAREIFWTAAADSCNRVIGNGLVGLHRLGDAACIPEILRLSAHSDPAFRATAAWAMGETADPRFIPDLGRMLRDADEKVRGRAFKALQRTKQTVSRAVSGTALRVDLCYPGPADTPGWGQAKVVALRSDGDTPALRPTHFVLSSEGRPISEYAVEPRRLPAQIEVALLFPERNGRPEEWRAAALRCLESKRGRDQWALIPYAPGGRRPSNWSLRLQDAHGRSLAGEGSGPVTVTRERVEAPRFTNARPTLSEAIQSAGETAERRATLWPTIRATAEWFVRERTPRHIIVWSDRPDEHEPDDLLWASQTSVRIHVVSCAPDPELRSLCEATSGTYECVPREEAAARMVDIYLSALAQYRITYRQDPEPGSGNLKLQVYSPEGFGESAIAGRPVSEDAQPEKGGTPAEAGQETT